MLLRSRKLSLSVFVAILCVSSAVAQAQAPAPAPAQRPTSTPYTGDLSRFDNAGRAERLQINRVMDALGIGPGKRVADIGAGSGFFTVLAARRVGDQGTVYAEDINPEAIQYIDARLKKEDLHNVKTVLGQPDNPLLPAPSTPCCCSRLTTRSRNRSSCSATCATCSPKMPRSE